MRHKRLHLLRFTSALTVVVMLLQTTGCTLFRKALLPYQDAELPQSQVIANIPYWVSPRADPAKNRLDLFLPTGRSWPVLVFVHGGEWVSGDKALKVMGADIYGNIGRFYASRGIGVAVINYRLMPGVDWKSQVMDVARAVSWVRTHIKRYKGNPDSVFLAGHSSGAQVSAKVALDEAIFQSLGLSPRVLRGVVLISGAGYDLTDEETYELAQKEKLFEKLFHTGSIPLAMRKRLSPTLDVNPGAPPFLILYSEKEEKELQHGSKRLHERLQNAGVKAGIREIPDADHKTIVLTVSHPDKPASAAIRAFVEALTAGP